MPLEPTWSAMDGQDASTEFRCGIVPLWGWKAAHQASLIGANSVLPSKHRRPNGETGRQITQQWWTIEECNDAGYSTFYGGGFSDFRRHESLRSAPASRTLTLSVELVAVIGFYAIRFSLEHASLAVYIIPLVHPESSKHHHLAYCNSHTTST